MSWVQAVKEFAKVKGSFSIPKKDSDEYNEVKKIQEAMKAGTWGVAPKKEVVAPEPDKSVRVERKKKVERASEPVPVLAKEAKEVVEPKEAVKKVRAKKGDVKVADALETSDKYTLEKPKPVFEGAEHSRSKRAKDKEPVAVPLAPVKETVEEAPKKRTPKNVIKSIKPGLEISNQKVILDFS